MSRFIGSDQPTGYTISLTGFHTPEITITHKKGRGRPPFAKAE